MGSLPTSIAAVLLTVAATAAEPPVLRPERDPAAFGATLDTLVPGLLEDYLTPGAVVAVIVDGKTAFIKGYGHADVEQERPVTADTVFNVGSVSKAAAAWGVMKLVEDGEIDLDAPVERYLTRWHLPESEFDSAGVTMRRLLSHTAGLSLQGYRGFPPTSTLPSLEDSLSGATNGSGNVHQMMAPGTQWRYSGGGYTLAQLIVEEVSGEEFSVYMHLAVLAPMGMTNSAFDWPTRIESVAAKPYSVLMQPMSGPRFTARAAAGLQATGRDMARFVEESLNPSVLDVTTVRLMQSPANSASPRYGLGYAIDPIAEGITHVGHSGANGGWMSDVGMILESGDGLVVLTNGAFGRTVIDQVRCAWKNWLAGIEPECRGPIGLLVASTIRREGVEAAITRYRKLRETRPDDFDFAEMQLKMAGFGLVSAGEVEAAIAVFQLNVEVFPNSWSTHDSLGKAYMSAGRIDEAIASYRRSLELNPENTAGAEALERLVQMK
jgi:CubicO group peptidase (beta-lactamase class C family)